MPFFATAGSKVYIGAAIAMKSSDFVIADLTTALTAAVQIGSLESIGSFGDTASPVTMSIIGEGRDKTIKGTRSAGTMELVAAIDYADLGQIALLAAEKSTSDYAFRVVFNDAPPGGTPSERQFIGKVMSAAEQLDTANNAMKLNTSIAINSNVVRVAAAEDD